MDNHAYAVFIFNSSIFILDTSIVRVIHNSNVPCFLTYLSPSPSLENYEQRDVPSLKIVDTFGGKHTDPITIMQFII